MTVALDEGIARYYERVVAADEPGVAQLTPEQARERIRRRRAAESAGPAMDSVRQVAIGGPGGELPCRLYKAVPDAELLMVYFHGGGWVTGDLDSSEPTVRRLAVSVRADVLNVEYRVAPEDPFPAAVEDARAAVATAGATFARGRPLVVAGESAGATLAAVVAAAAAPIEIAAQLLAYPVTDHRQERDSYRRRQVPGALSAADVAWYWDRYLADPSARAHPDASPLQRRDLSGAAPAVLVLAHHDPLFDEGLAYAARLHEAGVPIRVLEYPDAVHGFLALPVDSCVRARALAEISSALRGLIGAL